VNRVLIFIYFLSFFVLSCSIEEIATNESCYRTEAFFFSNRELEVTQINGKSLYMQKDGKGQVFVYAEVHDCSEINDDEVFESIVFSIPDNTQEFEFKDDQLSTIKCNYDIGGAWVISLSKSVNKGTISGRKISNSLWNIKANIVVDSTINGIQNKAFVFDTNFLNR
jgi:hypothetical protein